jgi:hypothetical protein
MEIRIDTFQVLASEEVSGKLHTLAVLSVSTEQEAGWAEELFLDELVKRKI